ncbi:type II toxin-antitoxin system VapB family antitoxin [Gammaproteobacteria bacterium]|nr:type II toxin-antitoxin system VapB family antitoxin [Gammaproteobacteria bacterium]
MSIRAKLFVNGRNQAVRIPKELEFKGVDAITIEKKGNALILMPARKTWESFAELSAADQDFMVLRPRLMKSIKS